MGQLDAPSPRRGDEHGGEGLVITLGSLYLKVPRTEYVPESGL